ncbi:hypothetical protein [Methylobacter sp. YRD-M1]|uniref:hypothetical protein n=1 Tax=Methylobacter sp. YRD-M1 TaxID=2911520 RepID=UPI00227B2C41|nr:hypothetical protein [Methylobacter sp. YRD-M1]WAK01870.1 hypothetical protein LZ558_18955 [Methylobacter sp. YRD-M1]
METMITGYQWKANKAFAGVYVFPNNLDKEEVYLPPNTTLVPVHTNIPEGQEAYWTGSGWSLRAIVPIV